MRIAMVQMECCWGELERNLAAMDSFARRARDAGAELVAFPELTLTGIYKNNRVWQLAEDPGGPSVSNACALARRHGLYVSFGFTEQGHPLPYNSYCVAAPDGSIAGIHRKNYIPHLEVEWWQAGQERPVFEVAGRRFAVAICWDTTQEELLAHYGNQGVEVVLMPHAWDADPLSSDGKDLRHDTMKELFDDYESGRLAAWRNHDGMLEQFLHYIPARAAQNGFYALFVNQCGRPHPAIRFEGPTFAVNPSGELLACTTNSAEQMLFLDIP